MEPVDALITHQPSSLSGGGAGNRTARAAADMADPAEIEGVAAAGGDGSGGVNPAKSGDVIDCDRNLGARAGLVETLTAAVRDLAGAGDLEAARVAHEALGKLLGAPTGQPAPVADLGVERARRGKAR